MAFGCATFYPAVYITIAFGNLVSLLAGGPRPTPLLVVLLACEGLAGVSDLWHHATWCMHSHESTHWEVHLTGSPLYGLTQFVCLCVCGTLTLVWCARNATVSHCVQLSEFLPPSGSPGSFCIGWPQACSASLAMGGSSSDDMRANHGLGLTHAIDVRRVWLNANPLEPERVL